VGRGNRTAFIENLVSFCYDAFMKNPKELQFNVIFCPEPEGGFTAIVPSLPGCISYGKDLKEAKESITDAIGGYIASIKKHKEKIPHDAGTFLSSIQFSAPLVKQHA
jgi:predicted RNase H-like HicB family nuclease